MVDNLRISLLICCKSTIRAQRIREFSFVPMDTERLADGETRRRRLHVSGAQYVAAMLIITLLLSRACGGWIYHTKMFHETGVIIDGGKKNPIRFHDVHREKPGTSRPIRPIIGFFFVIGLSASTNVP
ncbi:hypothetical protein EX30DRAFT_72773 [Ascodesmis nigricans]|uniref:Uncharacterized protein n=1 Tax=Ascodesmis nigricans TaxID=341454 RepID=A0A4S2MTW5_9PEZI|nr:hypothetical protein EX30DRAFT_72773 [Ascodesmis nigricans]